MSEWYVKLWSSILDSSLWTSQDIETKVVWITLLAMADADGYVHAAIPGIAHRAGVSLESCERAMKIFLEPDPLSRSQKYEGRRIARHDRDWVILNYAEFRARADKEAEKERKRLWWEKHRGKGATLDETSEPLDAPSETRPNSTQVEVEVLRTSKEVRGDKSPKTPKSTTEKKGTDPNVKRVLDSYVAGYEAAHMLKPVMNYGRAGKVAKELLECGNDPRLVALVAYWWGKAPLQRQVDTGFSAFQFLPQHFDAMHRSLRDEGVNLALDSPTLPIARFFSDPPAGQAPSGEVGAVPGDSR